MMDQNIKNRLLSICEGLHHENYNPTLVARNLTNFVHEIDKDSFVANKEIMGYKLSNILQLEYSQEEADKLVNSIIKILQTKYDNGYDVFRELPLLVK